VRNLAENFSDYFNLAEKPNSWKRLNITFDIALDINGKFGDKNHV
jgi:hypothetical protein